MIFVTRGLIIQENALLAAQRPASMSLAFKWELPGGKMEANESPQSCLIRETEEELGLIVEVREALEPVDNFFRNKTYRMLPFECVVVSGELVLYEHEQAVWCPLEELFSLDWAPAEEKLLRAWVKNKGIQVNSQATV